MPQAISNLLTQRRRMKDFLPFSWYIRIIALSLRLRLEDRMHLGNKNKSKFILYFARFALSLHPETKTKRYGNISSIRGRNIVFAQYRFELS